MAAFVFALAHLPILYATSDPPLWLFAVVIAVNVLAGAIFGLLSWRAGPEAAMVAHAISHAVALVTPSGLAG